MSKFAHDSYTGEPVYKYVSEIPDIQKGRSGFFSLSSAEAVAQRPALSWEILPVVGGFTLVRNGAAAELVCGSPLWGLYPTRWQAEVLLRWLVDNEASVEIALHWLRKKDIEPLFRLLDILTDLANTAAPLDPYKEDDNVRSAENLEDHPDPTGSPVADGGSRVQEGSDEPVRSDDHAEDVRGLPVEGGGSAGGLQEPRGAGDVAVEEGELGSSLVSPDRGSSAPDPVRGVAAE